MIHTIAEFEKYWKLETEATRKLLEQLTDKSLTQAVAPQDRTLGRMAWHLTSIPEDHANRSKCSGRRNDPVPHRRPPLWAYNLGSQSLWTNPAWTDATLLQKTICGELARMMALDYASNTPSNDDGVDAAGDWVPGFTRRGGVGGVWYAGAGSVKSSSGRLTPMGSYRVRFAKADGHETLGKNGKTPGIGTS
jgi:hypothetical protein